MLKTLILAAASALALVTLSGCASHATTAAATLHRPLPSRLWPPLPNACAWP